MKKIFIVFAMTFVSTMAFAHIFEIDKNGGCTIQGEVASTKSANDAYNAAKVWLNAQGFTQITPGVDKAGETFTSTVTLNTKNAYNPFAGQFVENLLFSITINFNEGKVDYKLDNIQIQEIYGGYGTSNKVNSIAQKINELEAAKKAVAEAEASTTMPKKDKKKVIKDNKDTIENTEETLNKASEELTKRLNSLKDAVK